MVFYKVGFGLLKFSKSLRDQNILKDVLRRNYATLYSKEFDVTQFCSVEVNCPYKISVQPIDLFQSQEKVIVKLESDDISPPSLECEKIGDTVSVKAPSNNDVINAKLNIEASVKASIKVTGDANPIDIGSFYGKYLDLKSVTGNVSLSKCQCENISVSTKGGNITCNGVLQAQHIKLNTEKKGTITTDRLQGLWLEAKTTSGNINIGSTYCESSMFETDFGSLSLQNVHRNVTVHINNEGLLNISGFDGILNTKINKGLVDIQLSRINANSLIFMKDSGTLILRLSDQCQESTGFKISASSCVIGQDVELQTERSDGLLLLNPRIEGKIGSYVIVDCKNSHVLVGSSSWSDMFKVKNQ